MKLKFSPRDYSQRLSATMLRYKGKACYVKVEGSSLYGKTSCSSGYDKIVSKHLDVSTVPLGYINHQGNGATYLMRRPCRVYKQGVALDNTRFCPLPGMQLNPHCRYEILDQAVFDMVNNKYPSIQDVLAEKNEGSWAISHDIAIHNNELGVKNVYYKNDLVGWMAPGTRTVVVPTSEKASIVSICIDGFDWEID